MPQVGQRPLDAIVAPTGIPPSHLHDQSGDFFGQRRPPVPLLPLVAVVPLLGYQAAMPAENGVRREQGADLGQHPPPQDFRLHCQPSALVIAQEDYQQELPRLADEAHNSPRLKLPVKNFSIVW